MRTWRRIVIGSLLVGWAGGRPFVSEGVEPSRLQVAQKTLGIPAQLARVIDVHGLPSNAYPDFFLIQDVHRHTQVQAQVSLLILHGYKHWGVKKVFMEGAFASSDLSAFKNVTTRRRARLLERLLREGSRTGPEVAAAQILERERRNPPVSPFQLFGMEDPELYRQNFQAYQQVVMLRGRALQDLDSVRNLQLSMEWAQPNELAYQLDRVESLLHLRLIPAEYDDYLKGRAAVPVTPALVPAVRAAEEFYHMVQLRSAVFLNQASYRVPASAAPRIIVVGGFHTAMMANLLRQKGRSFVILSPAVGRPDVDALYERRMRETADLMVQAFPSDVR